MTGLPLERPTRTRRIPLRGKVVIGAVLLAIGWAMLIPNTCTERVLVEQCTSCFATRRTAERGLWVYGSHMLSGGTSVSEDPDSGMDLGPLLGVKHDHQWRFSGMGYYFMGLCNGVACGTPGFNPLGVALRRDPGVLARIEERMAAGDFAPDEVISILQLPPVPTAKDSSDPSRLHLYRRGQDLLRSTGCGEAEHWPGASDREHPAGSPGAPK